MRGVVYGTRSMHIKAHKTNSKREGRASARHRARVVKGLSLSLKVRLHARVRAPPVTRFARLCLTRRVARCKGWFVIKNVY